MNIQEAIVGFVGTADLLSAKNWKESGYVHAKAPTHRADFISEKWCRVVVVENYNDGTNNNGGSVYAFICLQDGYTKTLGSLKAGDIHKPAGFKVPAKTARGNVFSPDYSKCMSSHGIAYLR
jgi:hypothetical protein